MHSTCKWNAGFCGRTYSAPYTTTIHTNIQRKRKTDEGGVELEGVAFYNRPLVKFKIISQHGEVTLIKNESDECGTINSLDFLMSALYGF